MKSYSYVIVICYQNRQIIFVCERESLDTVNRLAVWLEMHNRRRENIRFVSSDLGKVYLSGICRKFPNVRIVYDEFRAVKLIVEITNDTARWAVESQTIKVHTGYLMRMNVLKLSEGSKECSIENYCELTEDYRFNNVFSDIYKQYNKESVLKILDFWYHNAQALGTWAIRTISESILTLEGDPCVVQ